MQIGVPVELWWAGSERRFGGAKEKMYRMWGTCVIRLTVSNCHIPF